MTNTAPMTLVDVTNVGTGKLPAIVAKHTHQKKPADSEFSLPVCVGSRAASTGAVFLPLDP